MTKDEYMELHDSVFKRLKKEYGSYLYYLCVDVINISQMEKVVHELGYTTKRKVLEGNFTYDILYWKDKEIGRLNPMVGFPSIELIKRNKRHATKISKSELVIEPIKGVHRVLGCIERNWMERMNNKRSQILKDILDGR